jgi:hypothetical protein
MLTVLGNRPWKLFGLHGPELQNSEFIVWREVKVKPISGNKEQFG